MEVDLPAEMVDGMRQSPFWPDLERLAPTLVIDALHADGFDVPAAELSRITVPALVVDGATTGWLTVAADATAGALPHATRDTIAGQPHNVAPEAIAPVITTFLRRV